MLFMIRFMLQVLSSCTHEPTVVVEATAAGL